MKINLLNKIKTYFKGGARVFPTKISSPPPYTPYKHCNRCGELYCLCEINDLLNSIMKRLDEENSEPEQQKKEELQEPILDKYCD